MKTSIKKIFTYAAIVAAIALAPVKSQDKTDTLDAKIEFANLERSFAKSGYNRNRATFEMSTKYKGFTLAVSGINEINNSDDTTYFGRDVLELGTPDVAPCVIARSSYNQVLRMVGIRNRSLAKIIGDGGWIDAAAGKDETEFALFFGKNYGPIHPGVFHSMLAPYRGKPINYSELQIKADLTENINLVARMEIPEFSVRRSQYLIGIGVHI